MADVKNDTYPMLPTNQWWTLRRRFKQALPSGAVDANYLVTVLGVSERTAKATTLPNLKRIGLLDKDGKAWDRTRRWRDEEEYAKVCEEIRVEVYPQTLLDAVPNPVNEPADAKRWFASTTGGGDSAARKMARLYQLITEADVSKAPEAAKVSNGVRTAGKRGGTSNNSKAACVDHSPSANGADGDSSTHATVIPLRVPVVERVMAPPPSPQLPPTSSVVLHFHVSSDATTEYIDRILEITAKHLYNRGEVDNTAVTND